MALIPVYFNIDGEVSKALVKDDKTDFYLNLGAKRTPAEAVYETVTPYVETVEAKTSNTKEPEEESEAVEEEIKSVPGDKGPGRPDSFRFHSLKIAEIRSFNPLQDYVFSVTGKMIRRKENGTMERYRKNAIRLIKGHVNAS